MREANETLGAMDWEIPRPKVLLEENLTKFVHFFAADCGFDGSIEALAANCLHPLILAANGENPTWRQAMIGPFSD